MFSLPSPGDVFAGVGRALQGAENAVSNIVEGAIGAATGAFNGAGTSAEDGEATYVDPRSGQRGSINIEGGYVSASEFQAALKAQHDVNVALRNEVASLRAGGGSGGGGGFGGGDNSMLMLLALGGDLDTSDPLTLMLLMGGMGGGGGFGGAGGIAPIGFFGLRTLTP